MVDIVRNKWSTSPEYAQKPVYSPRLCAPLREGQPDRNLNKSFRDRGETFNGHVLVAAILEHLLHHASALNIKGESYRLNEKR